jgi:hypothetical protein
MVEVVSIHETQFCLSPHVISYMNPSVSDWSEGFRQARMAMSCPIVEMKSEFICICTHLPRIFTKDNFCMYALVAHLQCSVTAKSNCHSRFVCAIVISFFCCQIV